MYIKIGKYPKWIGPYQLAEYLMFWYPKVDDGYGGKESADAVHKLGDFLAHGFKGREHETWLYKLLAKLHRYKERKVVIKLHPSDTWNLDETLALIIVPLLEQLKVESNSYSTIKDGDAPDNLEDHEKWQWIMGEMIYGFKSCIGDWEAQFETGVFDMEFKQTKDGESILLPGVNHTHQVDYEEMNKAKTRADNGIMLFAKYYRGLWD